MSVTTANYILSTTIGETMITIPPQAIVELSIMQDMNKLLPTFHMKLADTQGVLTHLFPFDSKSNTFSAMFGLGSQNADEFNGMQFRIYRRKPVSNYQSSMVYDVVGMLDVKNLFAPSLSRASAVGMTIKNFLIEIASELGCDEYDISPTLDYVKTILQPNWTNAELIAYLRNHLEGKDGEGCYKIFITCVKSKKVFTCLTWNEMVTRQSNFKFVISQTPSEDFFPIMNYRIFDNYYALGARGSHKQDVEYFDYYTSTYVEDSLGPKGMISLTDYFMIDSNDPDYSDSVYLGRSTEDTMNFSGRSQSIYYNRLGGMVQMWADTWGLQNLIPGTVVMVMFPSSDPSSMANYQYNGLWVVEKVIHQFQQAFLTRMLLTRNGLDVVQATTLVPASYKATSIPTLFFPAFNRVPQFTGGFSV